MKGGPRPGAGRPHGSKSKRSAAVAEAAAAAGMSPIQYLLLVMRDSTQPISMRLDAAKAAAPYCHPRLNAITLDLSNIDVDDLRRAAA